MVGVGIPIPILDEDVARSVAVGDEDIRVNVVDFGIARRSRPTVAQFSYAQLRQGWVEWEGRRLRTGSLSSYAGARLVAEELKKWIVEKNFTLTQPVAPLTKEHQPVQLEGGVRA